MRVTTIYQLTIECCLSILMYVLWNAATSGSVELVVEASGLNLRMTESGMSDGWMMVQCMTDHQCRASVVLNQMSSQAGQKRTPLSKKNIIFILASHVSSSHKHPKLFCWKLIIRCCVGEHSKVKIIYVWNICMCKKNPTLALRMHAGQKGRSPAGMLAGSWG